MGYVYLVTNTINGKQYVGKTIKSIAKRWDDHCHASNRGSKLLFHTAIRKYGSDVFVIKEVYESSNEDDLLLFEIDLITKLETNISGYNMTSGGEGTGGRILSKISKSKISSAAKRSWQKNRSGHKMSEEAKKNISEAMRKSWAGRKDRSRKGKPVSEETKRKISEAMKTSWEKRKSKN